MLQDSKPIEKRHQQFLQEVTQTNLVWCLRSENGLVTSSSVEYMDESGEDIPVVCFWSNDKLARVCGNKYWPDYEVTSMSLSEFLEHWCIGMHHDGHLAGVNFDWNLFGREREPITLALDILEILKDQKEDLLWQDFETTQQFYEETKMAYQEWIGED